MNIQQTDALALFCAEQYYAFNADAWSRPSTEDADAATVAAMYLSMTSWYGHEDALERIAADARLTHINGEEFRRASQSVGFDLARFSGMVRYHIGLRKMGMSPGAAKGDA